ncbi:MAG: hypothetical protein GF411_15350 [Candidatus Lokiarchaeota archaeon]|nr:hypothetical protein [Candidatus Lokiarchaeota archaeon]
MLTGIPTKKIDSIEFGLLSPDNDFEPAVVASICIYLAHQYLIGKEPIRLSQNVVGAFFGFKSLPYVESQLIDKYLDIPSLERQ